MEFDTLSQITSYTELANTHIDGLPLSQRRIVLLCYDDSESSDYLLQWSLDNFFRDGVDHVVIATVFQNDDMKMTVKAMLNEEKVRRAEREKKAEIEGVQNVFSKILASRKISSQRYVLKGDPKDILMDLADRCRASVILVGARGRNKFYRTLLGSVSAYLVSNAEIPTVVVKQPKDSNSTFLAPPSPTSPITETIEVPTPIALKRTSTNATVHSVVSFTPSIRSHIDWSSVKLSFLEKLKEKFSTKYNNKKIKKEDLVVIPNTDVGSDLKA